jgi:Mg/Co/Ni transporter MgtE
LVVASAATDLPERTMEIFLDKRAVRQIRLSAQDAIEEGDTETLREDILEAFTEEQVEEIERRLDNGDFFEFLTDMLDEWSGDDVEELFELIDAQLGDVGVDVKFEKKPAAAADDEESKEEEEDEFDDEDDLDDEDEDDDEEEEEEEDEQP